MFDAISALVVLLLALEKQKDGMETKHDKEKQQKEEVAAVTDARYDDGEDDYGQVVF